MVLGQDLASAAVQYFDQFIPRYLAFQSLVHQIEQQFLKSLASLLPGLAHVAAVAEEVQQSRTAGEYGIYKDGKLNTKKYWNINYGS